MIKFLLWLILFFVLWKMQEIVSWQRLDIGQKEVLIQVVLYSDLPSDSTLLEEEMRSFSCDEAQCFTPMIHSILDREYFRYTGKHPKIKIRVTKPVNQKVLKLRPPSSQIEGFALVNRLWREFRMRKLNYWESDARIFVDIVAKPLKENTESSVGSSQGRIGYIEWRAGRSHNTYLWNITKTIHEIGHILGATDKYDGSGHSVFPKGVVQPELGSGARQTYVEIMSGTRPQGANSAEAEPRDYRELCFGPASALEMGWTIAPAKK